MKCAGGEDVEVCYGLSDIGASPLQGQVARFRPA